jgi:hypothetical protein
MIVYSALWLIMAALTGRWFFLGGALKCAGTANQHWQMSSKERNNRAPGGGTDVSAHAGADVTNNATTLKETGPGPIE